MDEEDEFEDEENDMPQVEMVTQDQELDFTGLVLRFASKNVCQAFARSFKDYRTNTDFLNHCIIKMFHRISWDCKLPALLYQVSILRTFQGINKDRWEIHKYRVLINVNADLIIIY